MAIPPIPPKLMTIAAKAWETLKPKMVAHYKVLKAEHDGYVGGAEGDIPGMLASFQSTYDRLLGGAAATSQLGRHVAGLERNIAVPAFLKDPAVVSWLSKAEVRDAFLALATAEYLHQELDGSLRAGLAETYSFETGERAELSEGNINAVVEGMVGGYRARFEEQSSLIVDAVNARIQDVRADLTNQMGGVQERLDSVSQYLVEELGRPVESLASNELLRQLNTILLARVFDPSTNKKIHELAERVRTGDLTGASHEAKQKVFLWAVRLLSNEQQTLPDAESYFALVENRPDAPEFAIASAILQLNRGEVTEALRVLRDIHTPDGHAAMIFALSKGQGQPSAVSWFERLNPTPAAQDISPMGWVSLATAFTKLGRWESAISVLERARPLSVEFPDLLFIEGMYRAVMVVPVEFREQAVNGNLISGNVLQTEGEEVERWRCSAVELLERAQVELRLINGHRAEHALLTKLWLMLGSSSETMRQNANVEATRLLAEKSFWAKLYPVLRQYSVRIDRENLETYLDVRLEVGGLSDEEWIARFLLALDTLGLQDRSAELLEFLERYRTELSSIVDPRFLTAVRIKALLGCEGQAVRAREELDTNRGVFSADQAAQLEAQIALIEGEDIRPRLERIYNESPTIVNLNALVQHLLHTQDIAALEPRARELYKVERSLINARIVAGCLLSRPDRDPVAVVKFLEEEHEVVARDRDLMSDLAWCLLECGNWKKARILNDQLLSEQPEVERHIGLDINIAIKSGDWEHFAAIFDREWPRRGNHSSRTLLLLAQLAHDGHVTAEKAFELVRLAADKGFDDVPVLVSAYNAALHMGKEDELSASWLKHAALTDTSGIVKTVSTRELVEEILPSLQRKNETLLDSFKASSVPVQLVTSMLRLPMSRLYCAIPSANERQTDSRKRLVLPFFGARAGQPHLSTSAKLGLDITSVLTLTNLGLLDKTLKTFKNVHIAPDTLQLLLKESRHVRFQQPSEVHFAKDVLDALSRSTLKPVSTDVVPPSWLVEEVGAQFAQLLEQARQSQGFVVAAFPTFRAGSLNEAVAVLRDYEPYSISCSTYIGCLLRSGKIARVVFDMAIDKLGRMDSGPQVDLPVAATNTMFCADDIALRYLHRAGILDVVEHAGLTLHCSPKLENEHRQVVAEANERDKTVAIIDSARSALRSGMEAGHVTQLIERPRSTRRRPLQNNETDNMPTVMAFLGAGNPIDCLAIDDRYFTRLNEIRDEADKPILTFSSLDVIACLEREDALGRAEGAHARHRLRAMGCAYVGVTEDELELLLEPCALDDDGLLNESQELTVFRQTLIHACAADWAHVQDRQFLDSILGALKKIVSNAWESADVSEGRASALTKWVFDGLGRPLWTAVGTGHANPLAAAKDIAALTISSLLLKASTWDAHRREVFHLVVDEEVLQSARIANVDLIETIVSQLMHYLEALSAQEGGSVVDSSFRNAAILSTMPMAIRERFMDDTDFGDSAKASIERVVQFGRAAAVRVDDIYRAAVNTAKNGSNIGSIYRMRLEDGAIKPELLMDGEWHDFLMPELGGLLEDSDARHESVRSAVQRLGPTFLDGERILAAVKNDALVMSDFDRLLQERIRGVRTRWTRIQEGREAPPVVQTLVPAALEYYVALLGPIEPSRNVRDYVSEILVPYRTRLIARDLTEGIRIACLGFFEPGLAPSQFVRHIEDNELWDALQQLTAVRDPFSILGMAEISLTRVDDLRFAELAAECIERLCATETFESPSFVATGLLAKLALSHVQKFDMAAVTHPYWKRMVAWMQAGVVLQCYGEFRFDLEALDAWVEQSLQPTHVASEVMDLYMEPLVAASWATPESVWDNVFRLLLSITTEREQSGLTVFHAERIRELVEGRTRTSFASFYAAGPCQSIESRGTQKLTVSDIEFAQRKLAEAPLSRVWLGLVMAAQVVPVPREVYAMGLNGLKSITLSVGDSNWDDALAGAAEAGLVAVAEGDIELANAIRDFVLRIASTVNSDERVSTVCRTLFVAAGAIRVEGDRARWIDEATKALSLGIPAGSPSSAAATLFRICGDLRPWYVGPASWAELYARSCS